MTSHPANEVEKAIDNGHHSAATAVLEMPMVNAEQPSPVTVDGCVKCSTPRDPKIGWCPRCGYYPMLGTHVEVDPWNGVQDGAVLAEQAEEPFSWRDVPAWVWTLGGGAVVLLAISITARLVTPPDSSLRTAWALAQLAIGVFAFAIGHFGCYLFAIMDNDSLSLLDMIMKPISVWAPTVRDLPKSFRRSAAGLWGATAALLAIAVIGGIPYSALWNWGGERRVKTNLVQAITQQAAQAGATDEDLEGAIGDFAGKAGADDLKNKEKDIQRKRSAECLIIGFMPLGDSDFSSLILASVSNGQLRYVGTVADGIPADVRRELNQKMREMLRTEPFVKCTLPGVWVEPQLVCNIRFQNWTDSRKMNKPLFDQIMADVVIK